MRLDTLPPLRWTAESMSRGDGEKHHEHGEPAQALQRRSPAPDIDRWAASFLPPSGSTGTISLLRAMTVGVQEQFTYQRRIERGVQTPGEPLLRVARSS
jgi:hypothetical protein